MIYFKNMTVNATTDEKNKNRVSSAEKNSDNILTLKNNFINTNKSWNKKNMAKFPNYQKKIKEL